MSPGRRVLLDESVPHDLVGHLGGHEVTTVQAMGWAGTKNGALLRAASTRLPDLLPHVPESQVALGDARAGSVTHVPAP